MKGNNKVDFYRHISSKRETRESVNVLLVTKDMEKAKILQSCVVSVFTSQTGLQESQIHENSGKVQSKEEIKFKQTGHIKSPWD